MDQMNLTKKFLLLSLLIAGLYSCSCNPEKIMEWMAKSPMFKGTPEVMAIGGFTSVTSNYSKSVVNDSSFSKIELRLYNGSLQELYENEANIARECAKTFVEASESEDYDKIEVFIIKTDEMNTSQILYQSQYLFDIDGLVEK